MTVRAKFVVTNITRGTEYAQIEMRPVMPKYVDGKLIPDSENSRFWDASPSGEFKMNVQSKASGFPFIAAMNPGDEFYFDIIPAKSGV